MRPAPTRSPSCRGRSAPRSGCSSRAEQSRATRGSCSTTVLLGLFSVGFTITILSVSIPRIADDLGSERAPSPGSSPARSWPSPCSARAPASSATCGATAACTACRWLRVVFAGSPRWPGAPGRCSRSASSARPPAPPSGPRRSPSSTGCSRRAPGPGHGLLVDGGAGGPVVGVVAAARSWRRSAGAGSSPARCPSPSPPWLLAMARAARDRAVATARFDSPAPITLAVGGHRRSSSPSTGARWGWSSPARRRRLRARPAASWCSSRIEPGRRTRCCRSPTCGAATSLPDPTQVFTNFAYMGGFIITPLFLAVGVRLRRDQAGG
jgi:hypothetical protein